MSAFELPFGYKSTTNKPDLFSLGPWSSLAEAKTNVPIGIRHLGKEVLVVDGGSVKKYWWKNGITDNDLIESSTYLPDYLSNQLYVPTNSLDTYTLGGFEIFPKAFFFKATATNSSSQIFRLSYGTTTPTETIFPIKLQNGDDLRGSDIEVNKPYLVLFNDSTNVWEVQGLGINYIDNSSRLTITGTNLDETLDSLDELILFARETGIVYGIEGSVTSGTGNSATLDFTAGKFQLLDNTTPSTPTYLSGVVTSKSALTLDSLVTGLTYWYVDDATDTIKQTTVAPTLSDYRTKVWLARTSYNATLGAITGIANIGVHVQQQAAQLRDLAKLFTIRLSGVQALSTVSTTNGRLAITSGSIYKFGINDNPLDSNTLPFAEFNSETLGSTYREVLRTGTQSIDLTDITTTQYYNGSTLTTATNNQFIKRYIWWFPSDESQNIRIGYGSDQFSSLADAKVSLSKQDALNNVTSGYSNAYLIGALVAQEGTVNFNLVADAEFVNTNEFGAFGGGTGTAAGSYLQIGNNLSDLADIVAAANNLNVYNKNQITNGLIDIGGSLGLGGQMTDNTIIDGNNLTYNINNLASFFRGDNQGAYINISGGTVTLSTVSGFMVLSDEFYNLSYSGIGQMTMSSSGININDTVNTNSIQSVTNGIQILANLGSLFYATDVNAQGIALHGDRHIPDLGGVKDEIKANVVDVTVGSTLTANQKNNYVRLDAVTNQDFTITNTTLEIGESFTFNCLDIGKFTFLEDTGVTVNDLDNLNGTVTKGAFIKVANNEYDFI